jgi:hypothetical protein
LTKKAGVPAAPLAWTPFAAEVAVHVCSGGVAWLAGVDDDHGPALAPELECGGESGGRSADDGDVAVPLDGVGGVVTHISTLRFTPDDARMLAIFARTSEER